jgi:hypothetical protein
LSDDYNKWISVYHVNKQWIFIPPQVFFQRFESNQKNLFFIIPFVFSHENRNAAELVQSFLRGTCFSHRKFQRSLASFLVIFFRFFEYFRPFCQMSFLIVLKNEEKTCEMISRLFAADSSSLSTDDFFRYD